MLGLQKLTFTGVESMYITSNYPRFSQRTQGHTTKKSDEPLLSKLYDVSKNIPKNKCVSYINKLYFYFYDKISLIN